MKKCKNCRHWQTPSRDRGEKWGFCYLTFTDKGKAVNQTLAKAIDFNQEAEICYLLTNAEFGCNQFEAMPPVG